MKKLLTAILSMSVIFYAHAQLNTTLMSHISYNFDLNDIWGWVAPDGTEYALVGTTQGVSIVSLADPQNAKEVAFVQGAASLWRDLKTWGNYAYVTADQPGTSEGLLVIDLSQLPAKATATHWKPLIDNNQLNTCHNLYIDENGVCYLAGCNVNSGGILTVDVASTPGSPVLLGKGAPIYAHDVFTRDNKMYVSEMSLGRLGIYDITDKTNPKLLATQQTPYQFTHNAWLSDNSKVVFTTDERENASVAAYDISNLNDIKQTDEFRPVYTVGTGTIPHNVHVKDDYLLISYYTAGGVIVDASHPDNLIEVANYDTYPGSGGGYYGAWGLYPFLPSGNILISDINTGLFVVKPTLKRACYLEGKTTDAITNQPLMNAEIKIISSQPNLVKSDIQGNYKTGQATAGNFDVQVTHDGYQSKTITVALQNGVVKTLNVALNPLNTYSVGGKAISSVSGVAVPQAKVIVSNADYSFNTTADANGNFSLGSIYAGTYDIAVGAWGYLHKIAKNVIIDNNKSITIALDKGYQDDFYFDLGWETSSNGATSGFWVRDVPVQATFGSVLATPAQDIDGDLGASCYLTGNSSGEAGYSDVDNGTVFLVSPRMDLTTYNDPIVSYYLWFFNDGGTGAPPDDHLVVKITNGIDTVVLEDVTESRSAWRAQSVFHLKGKIALTANMKIIYEASDLPPNGHIVKAAVDAFLIQNGTTTPVEEPSLAVIQWKAYPNPFSNQLQISYRLPDQAQTATLEIHNELGQLMDHITLKGNEGNIAVGDNLPEGLYFLRIRQANAVCNTLKILKTK